MSLEPGTDPSKAAECPDPQPAWSVGGPGKPPFWAVGSPQNWSQTWAPPEPLTPTLRGNAHLLPDPQETPGSLSLPCVSGCAKAGPSAPVLSGSLWVSLSVSQSPVLLSHLTNCPQRRPASVSAPCTPVWRLLKESLPGAELGSILGFHPVCLPRPHP